MAKKVSVLGSGSYGTAVAHHLAEKNGDEVHLYGRDPSVVAEINSNRTNTKYLGDGKLSNKLAATTDLEEAVNDVDYLFVAVPAQQVRRFMQRVEGYINSKTRIVNLAKGIEVKTFKRMSEVIKEESKVRKGNILTLSGPSFARDIVNPDGSVALTLGGIDERTVQETRDLIHTTDFQVFGSTDLVGVELGGALKNVYALMAGIINGSGGGDSYLGAYLPRATVEIDTISRFLGAHRDTMRGLAVEGDLTITCSEASRNFRFGKFYAESYNEVMCGEKAITLANEKLGFKTVEGYHTLKAIHRFVTDYNMFAPIVEELFDIFYRPKESGKSPRDAITSFREQDGIRQWENRPLASRVVGRVLPSLWYRRKSLLVKDMWKELSARYSGYTTHSD